MPALPVTGHLTWPKHRVLQASSPVEMNRRHAVSSREHQEHEPRQLDEIRAELGPDRATVSLDGRRMTVTRVFWAYWYLAAERQAMFLRRVFAEPAPWTRDPILRSHRFTNAYRASDRVSQSLCKM